MAPGLVYCSYEPATFIDTPNQKNICKFNCRKIKYYKYCSAVKNKNSPVTELEWPRGFQEVKVPRFHDSGTERW